MKSFKHRKPRKMAVLKPQRSAVVGDAPDSVISIGYALAKAKSATDAGTIMQTVPHASYAALKAHMNARPNLFLPEVHAAVASVLDAPKLSKAEALFV
jgi:hypothetical protein